jgi:hypothetical protein
MKWRIIPLLVAALMIIAVVFGGTTNVEAQSGNIWQAQFYNNSFLSGSPFATLTTYYVAYNWGDAPPVQGMPQSNWTARFTTSAYFNAGTYRFFVTADDSFTLRLNNNIVYSNIDAPQPGRSFTFDVPLAAGSYFVQVDYRQNSAQAYLFVNWTQGTSVRPTATPRPPRPTPIGRLITRYGDYTNCVRRNLHQVNCFKSDGQWNSPDAGSIRTEPKIAIWYPCNPGTIVKQPLRFGGLIVDTQCSKTGAGFFQKPKTGS